MGQGYHSRSPEEFREYLDRLNNENRSSNRKQLIILIDILILAVVLYLVHHILSSSSIHIGKNSTVVENFNNHRLVLTASQLSNDEGTLLYLLIVNPSDIFPKSISTWKVQYEWRTQDHQFCTSKALGSSLLVKPIPPHSSEILEILIPAPDPSDPHLPEKCKPSYFRNRGKFGLNSFEKRVMNLILFIADEKGNSTEFRLEINPYP